MTISTLCIIGAALCAIWSVVTIVLITVDLDKRGVKTSWLFMGPYIFRNLDLYRHKTIEAGGKIGWLYYSFLTTINGAWILAALAFAF